ncbi:inositol monophosphatase family protein [Halopelagius fulvigenes]|uniref:fructose-bisphosphatase n=1 Tax=Halopelagius fulvigenes TaxID=1198324 RepID=A0ABD5TT51_9EURY
MTTRETLSVDAAHEGAEYANRHFRSDLTVERKSSKTDVVTDIDRTTQRRVVSVIRDHFPDDAVVGEEEEERKTVPEEGYAWIIDPIDGTQNYTRGMHDWTTSVAVVEDGTPLSAVNVAPARGETYRATENGTRCDGRSVSVTDATDSETFVVAPTLRWTAGNADTVGSLSEILTERFGEVRRLGSAQLTLSMVASGALDAAVAFDEDPNAWDTVAGAYHVTQAGGTVTDLDGDPWRPHARGIVASNGEAHDALLDAVNAATE